MNILEEIIQSKYQEVADRKAHISSYELEKAVMFSRETISMADRIRTVPKAGIITEFKRKSPSKGVFNEAFLPEIITKGYVNNGAIGLSVLTDNQYFGGSKDDLLVARKTNENTPILRKDFMVDEYQILEAKAWGADVILLIAAGIDSKLLNRLAAFAHSVGLETLLEVHTEQELEGNLSEFIDMVGVNNRNLKTFDVDIELSMRISEVIPNQFVKISESGIKTPETIHSLLPYGFKGFLMGEAFMQTADPVEAFKEFVGRV